MIRIYPKTLSDKELEILCDILAKAYIDIRRRGGCRNRVCKDCELRKLCRNINRAESFLELEIEKRENEQCRHCK